MCCVEWEYTGQANLLQFDMLVSRGFYFFFHFGCLFFRSPTFVGERRRSRRRRPFSFDEFRHELQVGAGQIGLDPTVDALVQLRPKVVLPIARFACHQFRNDIISFKSIHPVLLTTF